MSDPNRWRPDPDADEKDWPLGMGPDGTLNYADDEADDEAGLADDEADEADLP